MKYYVYLMAIVSVIAALFIALNSDKFGSFCSKTQDCGYIFGGHSLYFGSEGGAFLIKTDAK